MMKIIPVNPVAVNLYGVGRANTEIITRIITLFSKILREIFNYFFAKNNVKLFIIYAYTYICIYIYIYMMLRYIIPPEC